jgi:hypothetical protein
MSDSESEQLSARVSALAETLEELESELEGRSRRPRIRSLVRFTREVTIPAVILVLRTNIEALKLLRRALRFADDGETTRERAESVAGGALSRLDDTLADLGDALTGEPTDDRARELLAEARDIRADLDARLDADPAAGDERDTDGVDIDVEAELRSLKDDVDGSDG